MGSLTKKNYHPYGINGSEDHLHIAFHLHPTIALAPLVKDIKLSTSSHVKSKNLFKNFTGWQDGYAAFTYSYKEKNALIEHIINQEEHHRHLSFKEELKQLLEEHGVKFEEKYLL